MKTTKEARPATTPRVSNPRKNPKNPKNPQAQETSPASMAIATSNDENVANNNNNNNESKDLPTSSGVSSATAPTTTEHAMNTNQPRVDPPACCLSIARGGGAAAAGAASASGPTKRSRKCELERLRRDVQRLQQLLERIQQDRHEKDQGANHWKLLAASEKLSSLQVIHQNTKLRNAIRQQQQMTQLIQKLCAKLGPSLQTMGSVQDNEWRLDVLSRHPQRRKYNADLILNHFYGKLPNRIINSGLVDVQQHLRFSKCCNADLLDLIAFVEVNLCSVFQGQYDVIGDLLWNDHINQVPLSDQMYVQNELAEFFDEDTSYWLASTCFGTAQSTSHRVLPHPRPPSTSTSSGTVTRSLVRRVDDDGCVTIFFKSVRETENEIVDSLQIVENSTGWFALVDGGCDANGTPRTILKCNMSAELMPLTHRLEQFTDLANSMQLGRFPDPSHLDSTTRKQLETQLRQLFTHLVTEVLWKYVDRQEACTAEHARTAMAAMDHATDKPRPWHAWC